jgi:hypothetical protein
MLKTLYLSINDVVSYFPGATVLISSEEKWGQYLFCVPFNMTLFGTG